MIGYTRSEEAVNNSFRALWMNLLGGFGFAAAIAWMAMEGGSVQLLDVIASGGQFPLFCLGLAGLTKSAQLPFSSCFLRHGRTDAFQRTASQCNYGQSGVYLLLRISPALQGNLTGLLIPVSAA